MKYKAAEKIIRILADDEEYFLKKRGTRYMIANRDNDTIAAGEGFTFDLWDCARFFGIEIPKVLED